MAGVVVVGRKAVEETRRERKDGKGKERAKEKENKTGRAAGRTQEEKDARILGKTTKRRLERRPRGEAEFHKLWPEQDHCLYRGCDGAGFLLHFGLPKLQPT